MSYHIGPHYNGASQHQYCINHMQHNTNFDNGMGLLPDMLNRGLRMRRECLEHFSRHRLQGKPLVSDPGMHHGTCVAHVPWCMSGSLTRGGGENVPGIRGACATRNFTYLLKGSWRRTDKTPLLDLVALTPTCVARQKVSNAHFNENEIRKIASSAHFW